MWNLQNCEQSALFGWALRGVVAQNQGATMQAGNSLYQRKTQPVARNAAVAGQALEA